MSDVERVYTIDESSGRGHIRVRIGKRLLVQEQCNADAAGRFVEVTAETFAELPPERVCGHCRHVAEPFDEAPE